MRKIFTFLLSVLFVSSLFAQEATINKATVAPVIGGDIDDAWDQADAVPLEKIYQGEEAPENPTLGEPGESYWKGLWDADGIYLLIYAADDIYEPYYNRIDETTDNAHTYDNIEVFFDVNQIKEDGGGGRPEGLNGHYQLAPAHSDAKEEGFDDGLMHTYTNGGFHYDYAINAVDFTPNWFYEEFIPWSVLKNSDGFLGDATVGYGFEIVICDNDAGLNGNEYRNRLVWSNNLHGDNDSYDNMDDAGLMFFDGYEQNYVAEITITGGDITVDGQTLTIETEVIGEDPEIPPTEPGLKWYIVEEETTAKVKFDEETGTVTPISDGIFTVYAESADGYVQSNQITINISNQVITVGEVSWIVDGFNDEPQADGRPNAAWISSTWGGYGNHTVRVDDGIMYFNSDSVLTNPWDMKVRQRPVIPVEYAEKEFMIGFVMWAAAPVNFQLVLEDASNGYVHWGVASGSNTPNAMPVDGNSRWDLTVTTQPEWFKMHFTPSNILENSGLDFCFQPGWVGTTNIFMDSLYLITVEDSAIVNWDWDPVAQNRQLETLNVYPNPATNVLNVSLSTPNSRVAIYNSVGIKVEETVVEGNIHTFDVSGYSPGLYFVKANNTVAKFIR